MVKASASIKGLAFDLGSWYWERYIPHISINVKKKKKKKIHFI